MANRRWNHTFTSTLDENIEVPAAAAYSNCMTMQTTDEKWHRSNEFESEAMWRQ
jgi:hypothetical protein